jgi:hypothetical protein
MDERVVEGLSKVRKALNETIDSEAGGEAGDLGAVNLSVAAERVDAFLTDVVESLMAEYDVDEEDAFDFVVSVADAMAEAGELPEMPAEDDEDDLQSEWLGAATTSGFAAVVLEVAAESSEE